MTAGELTTKLNELRDSQKLKNQTVEFVLNTKKYYLADKKVSPNRLRLEVSRKNYHTLSFDELSSWLHVVDQNEPVTLIDIDSGKEAEVGELFCTQMYLELAAKEEA